MYICLPIWAHSKVMCHSARFLTYSKKKIGSSTPPSSMMKTQRLIGVTNFNSIFPSSRLVFDLLPSLPFPLPLKVLYVSSLNVSTHIFVIYSQYIYMLSTMVVVLPISSPETLRRCIYIINCKVAFLPVSTLTNLRILYIYMYTIFHKTGKSENFALLLVALLHVKNCIYIYI